MRHGTVITRATSIEQGALLPSEKSAEAIEYLPQLVSAFGEMLVLLKKLEAHLTTLEQSRDRAILQSQWNAESLASSLEHSLGDILAEIARVESSARERNSTWGGSPSNAEQRELEETTYVEIGKLRQQQANLLFRLRELRGQDASDALCS